MPTDEREEGQPLGDLGFTRTPSEDDPRRDPNLLEAIAKVAPGTPLRQSVDDVIRSHEGALIVIGDPHELAFLYSGGIRLDAPFRPQLLYELAKMDGAIIVDTAVKRLAWANVQLMPDPTIPSDETGTRHRTAERVAKQTGRARHLGLAAARDGHRLRRARRGTSSTRSPTCWRRRTRRSPRSRRTGSGSSRC